MANAPQRGLDVHFVNGTSLKISFPKQTEDRYKRKLMLEDLLKKRVLVVEAEGAIHCIPFENVKYMSIYPVGASDVADVGVIKGAEISD